MCYIIKLELETAVSARCKCTIAGTAELETAVPVMVHSLIYGHMYLCPENKLDTSAS